MILPNRDVPASLFGEERRHLWKMFHNGQVGDALDNDSLVLLRDISIHFSIYLCSEGGSCNYGKSMVLGIEQLLYIFCSAQG
jgi:hypothetical protein